MLRVAVARLAVCLAAKLSQVRHRLALRRWCLTGLTMHLRRWPRPVTSGFSEVVKARKPGGHMAYRANSLVRGSATRRALIRCVRGHKPPDACRPYQSPASRARLTRGVQRAAGQLPWWRMPDGVPLSVVSGAVAVVRIRRALFGAQATPGACSCRLTAGHTSRGTVVTSPPHFVVGIHQDGTHMATCAVRPAGSPLSTSQEVRIPGRALSGHLAPPRMR
jgi:hypothetical protein